MRGPSSFVTKAFGSLALMTAGLSLTSAADAAANVCKKGCSSQAVEAMARVVAPRAAAPARTLSQPKVISSGITTTSPIAVEKVARGNFVRRNLHGGDGPSSDFILGSAGVGGASANPNMGGLLPGCAPSGNTPSKCLTGSGGNPGNGVGNQNDGTQLPGCVPSGGVPNKCDIVTGGDGVGAVPEPATWAMMLIGFGAIGAIARRRRRAPTVQIA